MVWKSGKSGIHTGRTVRSRFAHKTRSRREGLLIHSSSDENHEKTELVTYSLGKQNRWLLPEVIKANSVEIENEVVLIERFSSEGSKNNGRADCFSVYSPKSSTTHRPKRRFSHAKNLLRHGEHMKSRYEVAYPYPAGSWPAGRELSRQKVGTHLGHRKKNANVRFMLEEESDGNTEEIENLNSDSEHDFPDQWGFYKVSGRPSTFDLIDWMTAHGTRKLPESRNINTPTESRKRVENCEEQGLDKGKCIYVGTDDEMYDIHLELLVEIKETSRALIATEQDNGHPVRNKVRRRARRWRWRRKRWSRRFQNRGSGDNCEGPSSMQIGVFEPVVEDHTKSFSIALRNQDIRREALEQRWGKLYREGCSLPRIFALDVTPLISHHSNATEESLVLFRLVENQPGFSSNQVKAFVSIVMCHDRTISETMWPKLVSQMKANTVEQEMWSLEDVMDIMLACFCSNDAGLRNGKVDYSEPRKPKQSLSILNEVLGWNSKTFSAKGARKDVKKLLEKGMSNQLDSSSCSSVDLQFEQHMDCGICFEDLQVVGKLCVSSVTM